MKAIRSVEYIGSFAALNELPAIPLPEFAFAGRSNVGKSSLINMLCGRKNIARTSATPGKTQTINIYNVDDRWILADLPGYGYAKVSKKVRGGWPKLITDYLSRRKNLVLTFVLIDARIPPQKSDIDFINRMGEAKLAFAVVFTKTDALSRDKLSRNTRAFVEVLAKTWEPLPVIYHTSAKTGSGREILLNGIAKVIS